MEPTTDDDLELIDTSEDLHLNYEGHMCGSSTGWGVYYKAYTGQVPHPHKQWCNTCLELLPVYLLGKE